LYVWITLLLALAGPRAANAAPISYEIDWTLESVSAAPEDEVGAPLFTRVSFDPDTDRFGDFVVGWTPGGVLYEFDFAGVMNWLMSPDERGLIASALLTPENNTWFASTHAFRGPEFNFALDAPGLRLFSFCLSRNCEGFSGSNSGIRLSLEKPSFECFDFSFACEARGRYELREVTTVPEPASVAFASAAAAILLFVRAHRSAGTGRRAPRS
jgi:hypothetical protein